MGSVRDVESKGMVRLIQLSRTGYHFAWDRILGNWEDEPRVMRMKALFGKADLDDLYEFTLLHKAVLGLTKEDVRQVIKTYPSAINDGDAFGRTPLAWAAWRGDEETASLLLSNGASFDKTDNLSYSPLLYAARSNQIACVELLLHAGANAQATNNGGGTMLHLLGTMGRPSQDDFQLIDVSLREGVRVDARDKSGMTALHWAAASAKSETVSHLIRKGANYSLCDNKGMSPLCYALNQHQSMQTLLDEGADHVDSEIAGAGTFMHYVAKFADIKSLQLLNQYHLKPQNIKAKDREGKIPLQTMYQRNDIGPEFIDLFVQFLKMMDEDERSTSPRHDQRPPGAWPSDPRLRQRAKRRSSNASCAVDVSDASDDEFQDTLETISN